MMTTPSTSNSNTASRIAVVTGANKGIGYWIAWHLGMSGLFGHVLLGCRDATRGQEAVDSLTRDVKNVQFASLPLTLGDPASHHEFARQIDADFGKIDVLVNNAGFAFKNADPTPFAKQTKSTLDVNYRGTMHLTQTLLPLVHKGTDARIVNVASMSGRLGQVSAELQKKLSSSDLTMAQLDQYVDQFETRVQDGTHAEKGWSNSNYGTSKLFVIAATKVLARENSNIAINTCCPGYCKTDMTSQKGLRDPKDGAQNAVIPATMQNPPTGAFFSDYKEANW